MDHLSRLGFGGGCHWCTEAVFQHVAGVYLVEQGWLAALEAPTFAEGVLVHFEPLEVAAADLIKIHMATHNPYATHKLRQKYRSAIYCLDQDSLTGAREMLERSGDAQESDHRTGVLTFKEFKSNERKYLNYFLQDPDRPFCQRYIAPKLKILDENFPEFSEYSSNTGNGPG